MVRIPTDYELDQLRHMYDPVKAHDYYLRTRKLKGRKVGTATTSAQPEGFRIANQRRSEAAKPRQRRELAARIKGLEKKLNLLQDRIREMEQEARQENRKAKAKKERAAKERDKPKTAAEKAKEARDAKKYRDKNQQKLRNQRKEASSKSGGSSSSDKKKSGSKKHTLSDLKALATKVKGQIAVAKQKLAAL